MRGDVGAIQRPLDARAGWYSTGKRLRACEWALAVFFVYIAGISPFFHLRSPRAAVPFLIAAAAIGILFALAYAEEHGRWRWVSYARDWVTLAILFTAYREMDWFTPQRLDHHLENRWIEWDRILLDGYGIRHWIESLGPLGPNLLELSYLLVYAVGPFTVAVLYLTHRRHRLGWVLFVYVTGTLAAYALFPYFPSAPPRVVFPGADLPAITTALRRLNLYLVGNHGIHSSVFPSAHVSSAFSSAWAFRMFLPDLKVLVWLALAYAVLVSTAAVYGRYHYAADVFAGFAISLLPVIAVRLMPFSQPVRRSMFL